MSPTHSATNINSETGPINSPINSVQQDCFLSKLAEIDEGLSKLSVVSAPNYEGSGKTHSSHVINEGVKVTARVCPGQGSENHAPNSEEATRQKEEKKQVQNQGTWKRKTNPAATQINKCNASKEELVLPTKRSHEQLSSLNGLPSKKRMVSVEINPSILAEADGQPRPSQ